MGSPVARIGDNSAGHGGFPARPTAVGSADVFVNGLGAHRLGDAWPTHCNGSSCHGGVTASGSPTVFVNGKALARVGDPISCGDTIGEGSPNVFAG